MSDSDSEQSSSDVEEKEENDIPTANIMYDSSSGDEDSERCPICLLRLKLQPVGRPDQCKHLFCLACIVEWAKVTPSCPIDRSQFRQVFPRDHLEAGEGLLAQSVAPAEEEEEEEVFEEEDQTSCEVCRTGDREHILLLCDSCDLAYHTTCLTPPLARLPPGNWFCPDCQVVPQPRTRRGEQVIPRTGQLERIRRAVNVARIELERRFSGRVVVEGSRRLRGEGKKRVGGGGKRRKSRGKKGKKATGKVGRKRCGGNKRTAGGSSRRERAMLDNVRMAFGLPHESGHWTEQGGQHGLSGITLFGSAADLGPYVSEEEGGEDLMPGGPGGVVSRVMPRHLAVQRVALARRRHKVGVQLPQPASSPVTDLLGGILSSQTTLLDKTPTPTPSIGYSKTTRLSVPSDPRYHNSGARPHVSHARGRMKTAPVVDNNSPTTSGPAYATTSSQSNNNGGTGNVSSLRVSSPQSGPVGDSSSATDVDAGHDDLDLYGNIEGRDETTESLHGTGVNDSVGLPRLSAEGLRALARNSTGSQGGNSGTQLPPLSASGMIKLTQSYNSSDTSALYDPEEALSDDDENLVIDDKDESTDMIPLPDEDPMKDVENVSDDEISDIPLPPEELCDSSQGVSLEDEPNKIKFQLKSNSAPVFKHIEETSESISVVGDNKRKYKKKNIIADIFGSEGEDEIDKTDGRCRQGVPLKSSEADPTVAMENKVQKNVKTILEESQEAIAPSLDPALLSSIEENIAEERERVEYERKLAMAEELRQEVEEYSDVSDREIEETRDVRLRDLSLSPVDSDQSESFVCAATLEGLNPEAISPEEDFTSLSEEEEGEIKNLENMKRKRTLKLRKRELQRKVRELERQVIEISPNMPLNIDALVLEEGEIMEDPGSKKRKNREKNKKKKNPFDRNKSKKKEKGSKTATPLSTGEKLDPSNFTEDKENVGDILDGDATPTKDENPDPSTNSRNYRKKNADYDETLEESTNAVAAVRKNDVEKKKPELERYDVRRLLDAKKEKKEKEKEEKEKEKEKEKEALKPDPTMDVFGRDLQKKEKVKKRKPSPSRSKSRGRKVRKAGKKCASDSRSSTSSSSSSSSSSSAHSRSVKRKSKTRKNKHDSHNRNKKITLKKKMPVAEKIKKKIRSRSRSRNLRKKKYSASRSRSPIRKKKEKELRKIKQRGRSKSRDREGTVTASKRDQSKPHIRQRDLSRSRNRSRSRLRSKHRSRSRTRNAVSNKKSSNKSSSEKSVFSTGDKILVSLNFKENFEKDHSNNSLDVSRRSPSKPLVTNAKPDQKPSVIIDILDEEGPYRVIEQPKDVVDISMSDIEKEVEPTTSTKDATMEASLCTIRPPLTITANMHLQTPSKGPMTPPEPDRYDPFDPTVSPDNEPAHTPPLQPSTPPPGPQTPPPGPQTPPPASPSLPSSPPSSSTRHYTPPSGSSPGIPLTTTPKMSKINHKRAPLYISLPTNVAAVMDGKLQEPPTEVTSCSSPMDMDLDNDSPFSPGSGSDLSDLFEPPSSSPPPSSLPKISLPSSVSSTSRHGSKNKKKASDSEAWINIIGDGGKVVKKRPPLKQAINGPPSKMTVKVIDDKLKIIDEVPSSAVEMQVKDKFLKKVQRQERIVEEIKLVLKPVYNNRKISKEAYKEILRKTVPKVCHSRYGEINPFKIEKLVSGYVKKYQHLKMKTKSKISL